ncbi:MAG: endonuclease/exonuclease/phosphatase family protein [Promethearchaeota archaeon]
MGKLSVMSFNIRYLNSKDVDNHWDNRKAAVVEIIKKVDPDIFGIQEAYISQVRYLAENLEGYSWIGVGRDDGRSGGEHAAVFFKDKFEITGGSTFWLSDTPDVPSNTWNNACIRIATWGKFKMGEDPGEDLLFFNVHLDHRNKHARILSAKLILDKIKEINGGARVVIVGDFNAPRNEKTLLILKDGISGMKLLDAHDEWIAMGHHGILDYTWHDFHWKKRPLSLQFRDRLIDHVFFNDKMILKHYKIVDEKINGVMPSDHFPVHAIFEF